MIHYVKQEVWLDTRLPSSAVILCSYIYIYIYACVCVYISTYIHNYIYIYIYIYMHIPSSAPAPPSSQRRPAGVQAACKGVF